MKNPFKYGTRVGGNDFFDRKRVMVDTSDFCEGFDSLYNHADPILAYHLARVS